MFIVFYTLTQPRTWGSNWSRAGDICFFKQNKLIKKSSKPESQILRGVVYRLIEYLASMGHSSIWNLICAICACNILTVGVHLSSTPSISGPGSATDLWYRNVAWGRFICYNFNRQKRWFWHHRSPICAFVVRSDFLYQRDENQVF